VAHIRYHRVIPGLSHNVKVSIFGWKSHSIGGSDHSNVVFLVVPVEAVPLTVTVVGDLKVGKTGTEVRAVNEEDTICIGSRWIYSKRYLRNKVCCPGGVL